MWADVENHWHLSTLVLGTEALLHNIHDLLVKCILGEGSLTLFVKFPERIAVQGHLMS